MRALRFASVSHSQSFRHGWCIWWNVRHERAASYKSTPGEPEVVEARAFEHGPLVLKRRGGGIEPLHVSMPCELKSRLSTSPTHPGQLVQRARCQRRLWEWPTSLRKTDISLNLPAHPAIFHFRAGSSQTIPHSRGLAGNIAACTLRECGLTRRPVQMSTVLAQDHFYSDF